MFLSGNKDAAAMFQASIPINPLQLPFRTLNTTALYQVQDASVLIKMFDKDGSGALDVAEMYSLRQFLSDKKAKVKHALMCGAFRRTHTHTRIHTHTHTPTPVRSRIPSPNKMRM